MARARNIKPGIFKNEVLGVADPLYTILFEGLWVLADRAGRLEDRPLRVKAETFPYREGIDIEAMLGWLVANRFIRRYRVGGVAYVEIDNFVKHQNPHKNEPESVIPGPEHADAESEDFGGCPEFIGIARADSLSLDSGFLIADSSTPAKPSSAPARKPEKLKTSMPEGFAISERVARWAAEKGFDRLDEHLEALRRKSAANGYKKISWDDFLMEAVREDWAKLRGRGQNGAAPAAINAASPPSSDLLATQRLLDEQEAHRKRAAAAFLAKQAIKTMGQPQ